MIEGILLTRELSRSSTIHCILPRSTPQNIWQPLQHGIYRAGPHTRLICCVASSHVDDEHCLPRGIGRHAKGYFPKPAELLPCSRRGECPWRFNLRIRTSEFWRAHTFFTWKNNYPVSGFARDSGANWNTAPSLTSSLLFRSVVWERHVERRSSRHLRKNNNSCFNA